MWGVEEDRRGAVRYRFTVPVYLETDAQGRMRDMSTSGMFFETTEPHTRGKTVRLTFTLGDSTLHCEGRVVRVEEIVGGYGVALELACYDFS